MVPIASDKQKLTLGLPLSFLMLKGDGAYSISVVSLSQFSGNTISPLAPWESSIEESFENKAWKF